MKKWLWIGAGIASILVIAYIGFTFTQKSGYEHEKNITSKVERNTDAYLNRSEDTYLVYFYNESACADCGKYFDQLKTYEENPQALPVYKINVDELDSELVEDQLFVDKQYPYLMVVKDGHEDFRYVGAYPINELPTKTTK